MGGLAFGLKLRVMLAIADLEASILGPMVLGSVIICLSMAMFITRIGLAESSISASGVSRMNTYAGKVANYKD